MENFIKDTLKKQMQILSERSVRENGEYLAPITAQMIELAKLLDPELMINTEVGIKRIIKEELKKYELKVLEATLPPEFLQALQKQIPSLRHD